MPPIIVWATHVNVSLKKNVAKQMYDQLFKFIPIQNAGSPSLAFTAPKYE